MTDPEDGRSVDTAIRDHVALLQIRADALDPEFGIFTTRFVESAARRAEELDSGAIAINSNPMFGKVVGVKDILETIEGPTTGQSRVPPPELRPGRDADSVDRLRAAGAVIAGKTTTMEYALGLPDCDAPYPTSRNPWDSSRWPGGSSTGSAVGVAVDTLDVALGTDTMGSIRVPAACCGVTGIKPTFGAVPLGGCLPVAHSLDHIGPIGRSVGDCWDVLRVISTSTGLRAVRAPERLDDIRIGVVEGIVPSGEDTQLWPRFEEAIRVLESLGATLRPVDLAYYDDAATCATIISSAEAASFHRPNFDTRWGDYGSSLRLSLALGILTAASDYVEAQRLRHLMLRATKSLFESVDALVMPTMSVAAPPYGPDGSVDLGPVLPHIHARYWDLTGNPAIAMPMGLNRDELPLSVQLVGRHNADQFLAGLGIAFQMQTDFHELRPPRTQRSIAPTEHRPTRPAANEDDIPVIRQRLQAFGIPSEDNELSDIAGAHRAIQDAAARLYIHAHADGKDASFHA